MSVVSSETPSRPTWSIETRSFAPHPPQMMRMTRWPRDKASSHLSRRQSPKAAWQARHLPASSFCAGSLKVPPGPRPWPFIGGFALNPVEVAVRTEVSGRTPCPRMNYNSDRPGQQRNAYKHSRSGMDTSPAGKPCFFISLSPHCRDPRFSWQRIRFAPRSSRRKSPGSRRRPRCRASRRSHSRRRGGSSAWGGAWGS